MVSLYAMAKYGEWSSMCFYPPYQIQFICLLPYLIGLILRSELPAQI